MSLHSIVKRDSPTRLGLTLRDGRGVRPLRAHSETPCGASIEQKLAALFISALDMRYILNHVLIDHIYSTLLGLKDVLEGVLRLSGTSGEANNDHRGIVVDHLSVTERSKVR